MSPDTPQRIAAQFNRRFALRLGALTAAILVIVLGPYFLTRNWSEEALEAEAWLQHTEEVSKTSAALLLSLREIEATTYGVLAGIQSPTLRQRYAQSRARVMPLLADVQRLTKDNADQQVRLGQVQLLLEQRLPFLDNAIASDDPAVHQNAIRELKELLDAGTASSLTEALVLAEGRLLAERRASAQSKRDDVQWLQTVSMFAQLLLLGAIAWVTERQVRGRREAETVSSAAANRSRAIFHAVREPIALLDGSLHILTFNTAFAELYGVDANATTPPLLAKSSAGAWNDPTLQQRLMDVLARDREIWDYEHRQRTADGVMRQVMVNAKRIMLPDNSDHAVLLTVSDVTPLKMAETHVLELNRELEKKVDQVSEVNRELEAFSYSVSHDLRAPLRHISGFADKLRRHIDPEDLADERTRHYLDVIGSSAQRMAVLIDDLLLYSRLGRHAMRMQPVELDKLVRDVRDMLTSNRDDARLEWHVQPLPMVLGDETMLRQVWQNLLGNAIKYSATRDLAVIDVRHRIDNGVHEFCVRDNGVGFDMDYAGKLFGVFQRLHKASEFPGSGIGLANVRRIVLRHGGRVWADAELGRGAAFYFTLPVRQDQPTERDMAESTR